MGIPIAAERNRNKRRDKKIKKKKSGMRVDDSARKLARLKKDQLGMSLTFREFGGW